MALIAICSSWVLGIYLGSIFNLPWTMMAIGLVPVPSIFLIKRYRNSLAVLAICLAALFGAIYFYPDSLPQENRIAAFNNQGKVTLEGIVSSPPDIREKTTHLEMSVNTINGDIITGKVLVFVPQYPEYRYDDILSLEGNLTDPPQFDGFDYQAYLARQDIYSTMLYPSIRILSHGTGNGILEWILNFRENLSDSLARALPEPQASLAQGILLGVRGSVPDDLRNELSITGAAHLLAISGINLTIIAGVLIKLGLWIFGRRHYVYIWLALFMVWFYALITGVQAPVIRAAIMASMFLFAELLGRQKSVLPALAFSAAIMVGLDPQQLWSVSFQLTFLSMIGLIIITPFLEDLIRQAVYAVFGQDRFGVGMLTTMTDSFCVTLGALIAIWPIIAYDFGVVSFVGPLSTFLIAPVLPFIIGASALTALIGLANSLFSQWIGWLAWLPLSYMLWLVSIFASLPGAYIQMNAVPSAFLYIYYMIFGLVICITGNLQKVFRLFPGVIDRIKEFLSKGLEVLASAPKKFIVIPLLLIAILTSLGAASMPDRDLHVSFLDVGEGSAVLIQIGGQSVLIDGGPDPELVVRRISEKMPFWDRTLDLLVLTHPHQDHLSGLVEVIRRYDVSQVLSPGLAADSPLFQEWMNLISARNIKHNAALAGQRITLNNNATLDVLHPPEGYSVSSEEDFENGGIVARLSMGQITFLFTGDIGKECEAELIRQHTVLSSTILQVAHHGSSTSTTAAFLSAVRPQIAVIPVGSDNRFGHPNKQVLDRLSSQTIYRTDLSGTIEFTTDGQNLWVKTER